MYLTAASKSVNNEEGVPKKLIKVKETARPKALFTLHEYLDIDGACETVLNYASRELLVTKHSTRNRTLKSHHHHFKGEQ